MTAQWLSDYGGEWTATALKEAVMKAIADAGKKNGEILWPLRVALSLRPASPDVFDLLEVLGRAESLRRVNVFCNGV
jgi:glutamyl-tRNA synthetase